MSAETTTTTLTEIINSEVIDAMIASYAIDANVIAPLVSYRSIAGQATKTVAFTRWDKDTGTDITEATAISSNDDLTLSENTVTVAQVGILRELTDFAAATTVLGEAGINAMIVKDGVALCQEMREDDLAALFISAT